MRREQRERVLLRIRINVTPILIIMACCLGFLGSNAQLKINRPDTTITPATDTVPRLVNIEQADRLRYKKVDTTNELQIAAGNVIFRDGKTKVYCDSAVYNKNKKIIEAFGNVHIIDSDTIHTYSRYLIYHSDTKLANLEKQVKLTDGKNILTTENLDYDTNLKIGTYRNGGKIISEKTTVTSEEAVYYSELKDVYFKRNVQLKDPSYDLTTDSLLYNTDSQLATFITDTYIKDTSGTEVVTNNGFYNLKTKTSQLTGRSTVKDKSLTVTGDELAMDDKSGMFEARGNAIMFDTAQGLTVIANNIKADRDNNTFLATEHPLMILEQDNDSVYITADTLFSGIMKDDTIVQKNTVNPKGINVNGRDSLKRDSTPVSTDALLAQKQKLFQTDTLAKKEMLSQTDTSLIPNSFQNDTLLAQKEIPSQTDMLLTRKLIPFQTDTSQKAIPSKTDTLQARTLIPFKTDTSLAQKTVPLQKNILLASNGTPVKQDTLSARTAAVSKKDSTNRNRFFQGFHRVRIFSDSLQAVSDSLFYSGRDSTFRLFTNPVLWANKSQVTGDTIYLYTKNKKPERLKVFENAMMINLAGNGLYNQLRGTTIDAFFRNGDIDFVASEGSPAESVYYVQDEDSAFVGMNTATARNIDMYFLAKELNRVVYKKEVAGTTYPILQVPEDKKTLKNFKWQENRRPKTKFELFEDMEESVPAPTPVSGAMEELTIRSALPVKQ